MKVETEFKILNYEDVILDDYLVTKFNSPQEVIHSNMHFTVNGVTTKLRVYHDMIDESRKYSVISKRNVDGKTVIRSKVEKEEFLTLSEFNILLNTIIEQIQPKNIVYYTMTKNRFTQNTKIGKITIDYCKFNTEPININIFEDIDTLEKVDGLEKFVDNLNKFNIPLSIVKDYIEVETLNKDVSAKKLLKFIKNDMKEAGISYYILETLFITDKGIGSIVNSIIKTYNELKINPKSISPKAEDKYTNQIMNRIVKEEINGKKKNSDKEKEVKKKKDNKSKDKKKKEK